LEKRGGSSGWRGEEWRQFRLKRRREEAIQVGELEMRQFRLESRRDETIQVVRRRRVEVVQDGEEER
jgi:hypothetical protein